MASSAPAVWAAGFVCLLGISTAEAAHCRSGQYYRPSRGICVSERAFRRDVQRAGFHAARGGRRLARHRRGVRVVVVEREVPVYIERVVRREKPAPVALASADPDILPVTTGSVAPAPAPAQEPEPALAVPLPYVTGGLHSLSPLPPKARGWEWQR
ncbi:hypothetical protein J2X36_004011 [Methylobacterium sp. BE186]|uniref:hypothetical protein n=1 Tax=Methylobacterium sp. BE186 TaxID=2817715 RepID=UPI00285577E8|nr:hypothetical protein [Methylobacterium sp. BE186]MDR7039238.1 hypothetical protein [Methylobacterium sp. BE186]